MSKKRNLENSYEKNEDEKRLKKEQDIIDALQQNEYKEWEEEKEDLPKKRKNSDDLIEDLPNKKRSISDKESFYKIKEDLDNKIDSIPEFFIRKNIQNILAKIENIRDDNIPAQLIEQRDKWKNPSDEIKSNLANATKETFDSFYNYFKDNQNINRTALNSNSDFYRYLFGFFAIDAKRSAKLLYNFCSYLCELSTKEKSEIKALLLSYPPNNSDELNCLDGNFERIEYLYRKLRVLDEEEVLLNAHNQVMLKFASDLEYFVKDGNQIHITPLLEKVIGLRKESAVHALSQIPSETIFSLFSQYPKLFKEELKTELSKLHNSFDSIKDALDNFVEKDENGQFDIDEFSFRYKDITSVFNIINQLSGTLVSEGNSLFEETTNEDELLNFGPEDKKKYTAKYDNATSSFNDKLKPSLKFIEQEIQKYQTQVNTESELLNQLRQLEGIYQSEGFLPIVSKLINEPETPYEFLSGCEALWSVSERFLGSSSYYLAKVLLDSDANTREEKIAKFKENLKKIDEILPNQSERFAALHSSLVKTYKEMYNRSGLEYNDTTLDSIVETAKLNHLIVSIGYPNHIVIDAINERSNKKTLMGFLDNTNIEHQHREANGNTLGKVLSSRSGFENILLNLYEKVIESKNEKLSENSLFIVERTFKYCGNTNNKIEKIPLIIEALLQKGFDKYYLHDVFYSSKILDRLASFNEGNHFKKLLSYIPKNQLKHLPLIGGTIYPYQNLLQNPLYIIASKGNFKFLTELHDGDYLSYKDMLKYNPALLHIASAKQDFSFIKETLLAENNPISLSKLFELVDEKNRNPIDYLGTKVGKLFELLPQEYLDNYIGSNNSTLFYESCVRNSHHLVSYLLNADRNSEINIILGSNQQSPFKGAFINKADLSLVELLNHRIFNDKEIVVLFNFMVQTNEKGFLRKIFFNSLENDNADAFLNLLEANIFNGLKLRTEEKNDLLLDTIGFFMLSESLCLNEKSADLIFKKLLQDSNHQNLIDQLPDCIEEIIKYQSSQEKNVKINPNSLSKYGEDLANKSSKFSEFLIEYSIKNQINDIGISPVILFTNTLKEIEGVQDYNQINKDSKTYKLLEEFVDFIPNKESLKDLSKYILEGNIKDCVLIDIAVRKNLLEINSNNIEIFIKNNIDNLSSEEDSIFFIQNFKYLANSFVTKNHSNEEKLQFSETIISTINSINNPEGKQLALVFSQLECCLDNKFKEAFLRQDLIDISNQTSPVKIEEETNNYRTSTPSPSLSFERSDYEDEEENEMPDTSISSPSLEKTPSNNRTK